MTLLQYSSPGRQGRQETLLLPTTELEEGCPHPYLLLIDAHGMRPDRAAQALHCVSKVMTEGLAATDVPNEALFVQLLRQAATALAALLPDEVEERQRHPNALIGERGETALSLILLYPTAQGIEVLHLGNLRLYRHRATEGVVHRTRDNTFVANLFDEGEITFGGMSVHPRRHLLTRALIPLTDTEIAAEAAFLQPVRTHLTHLQPTDTLLIATAGFVEGMADEQLTQLLTQPHDTRSPFDRLTDRAERHAASIDTWVEQKSELDPADILAADALAAILLTEVNTWTLSTTPSIPPPPPTPTTPNDEDEDDDPRALPLSKETLADTLRVFWHSNRASFFWTLGIVLALLTSAAIFDKHRGTDTTSTSNTTDTLPPQPSNTSQGPGFDDIPLFDRPPLTPPHPIDRSLPTPPTSTASDLPEPPTTPTTPTEAATPTTKPTTPTKSAPPVKPATPTEAATPTTPQKTTPRRQQYDDDFAVPLKES